MELKVISFDHNGTNLLLCHCIRLLFVPVVVIGLIITLNLVFERIIHVKNSLQTTLVCWS